MERKMVIKLVIDSASYFDLEDTKRLGITLMPMEITFGDETYLDGVNLTHRKFFEKLIESAELPKTSQINSFRFEECFEELTSNGDDVLVITLSSKLSGTFNSAKQAAKKFEGKVYVVDSLNACIGERILCEYALRLIEKGLNIEEIVKELENSKNKICVLGLLDTLKYLKKGGRISAVVAFTGEMFSIKPVVSIKNGEVKLVGKAMGIEKR